MLDPGDVPGGHPELWIPDPPPDRGPEGNVEMWAEAESYLEHLANVSDRQDNEAITVALVDAYNRCVEERRRAEDLLALRKRWAERRIGGVVTPQSPVRGGPPS